MVNQPSTQFLRIGLAAAALLALGGCGRIPLASPQTDSLAAFRQPPPPLALSDAAAAGRWALGTGPEARLTGAATFALDRSGRRLDSLITGWMLAYVLPTGRQRYVDLDFRSEARVLETAGKLDLYFSHLNFKAFELSPQQVATVPAGGLEALKLPSQRASIAYALKSGLEEGDSYDVVAQAIGQGEITVMSREHGKVSDRLTFDAATGKLHAASLKSDASDAIGEPKARPEADDAEAETP